MKALDWIKQIYRPTILRIIVFIMLVGIISIIRNILFPIIEPLGHFGKPTFKLVFGLPVFFIPEDFRYCIVYGPQFFPLNFIINIVLYFPFTAAMEKLIKRYQKKS